MRKLCIKQYNALVEKLCTNLDCPRKHKNLSHVNMSVNHRSKLIFAYRKYEVCLFLVVLEDSM